MRFDNRRQAGQELAVRLLEWAGSGDLTGALVLALPRGGVPVGAEVARALHVPLDVLTVRKIGVPGSPEVGIGALVDEDPPLFDTGHMAALHLDEHTFGPTVERERTELRRREDAYREGRPAPHAHGRSVLLVDDGLATGMTARAAVRHVLRQDPVRLVLAVPVGDPDVVEGLREEGADVVCLHQPQALMSVGQWYDDFAQVSDQEVLEALRELHPAT
ncbi:phosphoribosyltransferase [Streptomyces iconiensis]|uniref:Phosphoribosyltransferase family protein n=1 Tax=Streptomyces iconiensis TaxID=1384038 RepID=A0ABT6ZQF8_9ACTN|nr:phosphoribosyltransferase family protein [Streptomyces iconiensis]MDJ1131284.1 phosphoribosyltransferase family protein [Streptomyces iconiensis]